MRPSISRVSAFAVLFLAALVAGAPAQEEPAGELVAYAYNLQHRGATEALDLVLPMLSTRGAVELQPGGNALVVRDTVNVLQRIRPKLREFDHPFEPLRLKVQIIRAERGVGVERSRELTGASPDLPTGVLSRLHELLNYDRYSLLAGSELSVEEGMAVVQDIGEGYRVDFRLRHLLAAERASLDGFRLSRDAGESFEPLIHANLNLDLKRPMVLGLAPSEGSRSALMLVIQNLPVRMARFRDGRPADEVAADGPRKAER